MGKTVFVINASTALLFVPPVPTNTKRIPTSCCRLRLIGTIQVLLLLLRCCLVPRTSICGCDHPQFSPDFKCRLLFGAKYLTVHQQRSAIYHSDFNGKKTGGLYCWFESRRLSSLSNRLLNDKCITFLVVHFLVFVSFPFSRCFYWLVDPMDWVWYNRRYLSKSPKRGEYSDIH